MNSNNGNRKLIFPFVHVLVPVIQTTEIEEVGRLFLSYKLE